MRIVICTPLWGRADVVRVYWAGAARLRATWGRHDVATFVAGDEAEHRTAALNSVSARAAGARWFEHANLPLGRKWNALTSAALADGADAVVILGSDDIIDPELADAYGRLFDTGGPAMYAGIRGCAMAEPATRRALHIRGHVGRHRFDEVLGAGRVFSRAALEKVAGEPWPPHISRGLDFRQTMRFRKAGIPGADMVLEEGLLLDIKSGTNIWSYDHIARRTGAVQDYEAIVSRFPERELIRELEESC